MPWKNGRGETTRSRPRRRARRPRRFRLARQHGARRPQRTLIESSPTSTGPVDARRGRPALTSPRAGHRADRSSSPRRSRRSADHGRAGRRPGARSQRHDPPQRISARPHRLAIAGERQLRIDSSTALLLCRSGHRRRRGRGESAALQPDELLLVESGAAAPLEPAVTCNLGHIRGPHPPSAGLVRRRHHALEPVQRQIRPALGTSWPPGWSTNVSAEPGAQPVHDRCQNWPTRREAVGMGVARSH